MTIPSVTLSRSVRLCDRQYCEILGHSHNRRSGRDNMAKFVGTWKFVSGQNAEKMLEVAGRY